MTIVTLYQHTTPPEPICETLALGPTGYVRHGVLERLNFHVHDYLGLSRHRQLRLRAISTAQQYGMGLAAPRARGGNLEIFMRIEDELAKSLQRPAVMVLPDAWPNMQPLWQAILDYAGGARPPMIIADTRCDPMWRACWQEMGVATAIIDLRDPPAAHAVMAAAINHTPILFSETCFGQSGELADLLLLREMATRYRAKLVLDDSHGFGVLGPGGMGLAQGMDTADFTLINLAYAGAGAGMAVTCNAVAKEFLLRHPQTGGSIPLPPMLWGAIQAALEIIPAMTVERARLVAQSNYLQSGLRGLGFAPATALAAAHIVALPTPQGWQADTWYQALLRHGLSCAFDPGAGIVRMLLTAAHQPAHLDQALQAVGTALAKTPVIAAAA